jgi:hypothetical protein
VTRRQRWLVHQWIIIGVLVAAEIVFGGRASGTWSWATWILLAGVTVKLLKDQPSGSLASAFERINRMANMHPFVKLWLAICGLAIAAVIVWVTNSSASFEGFLEMRSVLIALLVLMGPIVWMSQRELFIAYGQNREAD